MSDILKFFTESSWGVFISSILASLIATGLYKLGQVYITKQRNKNRFVRYVSAFCLGARASTAKSTSYKQILLVGDYIIDIMIKCTRIICVLVVATLFVVLLRNVWLWGIPIILASFLITIDVLKIRKLRMLYSQTFEMVYGTDYLDRETYAAIDSAKEYNKDHNASK